MSDEERPMQIKIDMTDNLPAGYGDQERIQQILDNLVENSYQYTPENGQILIRVRQVRKNCRLMSKITALALFPKKNPRIFERFYRGEDPLVSGNIRHWAGTIDCAAPGGNAPWTNLV